jgi:outer membrane protein insertion porin family
MRQFESSWFDSEKIRLSKERVNRTGYVKDSEITTADVPGSPDQVDINVKVEEKPTGAISIGAGFSSTEKLIFTAGINQENALGTGTSIGLNFALGKINQSLALSQYDPYFTEDGISRYTDLFYRSTKPLFYVGDAAYQIKSVGTNLKFGVPYTEVDRIFFGSGYELFDINVTQNTPQPYQNYASAWGVATPPGGRVQTYSIPATVGWARDGRDSALIPSKGSLQRLSAEVGTPLGNLTFYQLNAQYQHYYSFSKGNILSFNGEVGYGEAYGSKPYPITKNYYVGGIGSVRGYAPGSLGPQYLNPFVGRSLPTGGQSKIVTNVEYTFPVPGSGVDKTLRLFGFVDGGNAFQDINLVLRYSHGVGLSWISPLGPLKFSYGMPIKSQPNDNIQRLQFQVGTAF